MSKSSFSPYTDQETIGMDHPLFMAKTQARVSAMFEARLGTPLDDALQAIPNQIQALFGDMPDALVRGEILAAYADVAAEDEAPG